MVKIQIMQLLKKLFLIAILSFMNFILPLWILKMDTIVHCNYPVRLPTALTLLVIISQIYVPIFFFI